MSYLYQTPIKMPRGLHYGSDYWISNSFKLKRNVHLYSMLEYANFIELEMNPSVEYFCEQPLKIEGIYADKKQSSMFDFWVYFNDGTCEFQEIKYTTELNGTDDAARRSRKQIEFQKDWCQKNKCIHKVVTEQDLLCDQFRNANLQILHSHLLRNEYITPSEYMKLLNYLSKQKLSIGEIKAYELLPQEHEISILAQLVYSGRIEMNLSNRPLDNNTEVTICETKNIIL